MSIAVRVDDNPWTPCYLECHSTGIVLRCDGLAAQCHAAFFRDPMRLTSGRVAPQCMHLARARCKTCHTQSLELLRCGASSGSYSSRETLGPFVITWLRANVSQSARPASNLDPDGGIDDHPCSCSMQMLQAAHKLSPPPCFAALTARRVLDRHVNLVKHSGIGVRCTPLHEAIPQGPQHRLDPAIDDDEHVPVAGARQGIGARADLVQGLCVGGGAEPLQIHYVLDIGAIAWLAAAHQSALNAADARVP